MPFGTIHACRAVVDYQIMMIYIPAFRFRQQLVTKIRRHGARIPAQSHVIIRYIASPDHKGRLVYKEKAKSISTPGSLLESSCAVHAAQIDTVSVGIRKLLG